MPSLEKLLLEHTGIETIWKSSRDLEERRMRFAQIYIHVLLYFLLKAAAFDVHPSYQNSGKILRAHSKA